MRLPSGKRLKWEPAALMVLVLGLGLWLAVGPASGPRLPLREGARKVTVRLADWRGVVEILEQGGEPRFRVLFAEHASPEMSAEEFRRLVGPGTYNDVLAGGRNWIFPALNITSWVNLVWVGIGLGGQLAFSGRMLVQWLMSERRRKSVITESFWWFSMVGGLFLFSYFVWRQDPVGILGQATGIVIYARNLRLIYKHKRRAARDDANPQMPAGPS
ncbi:MAG: lipid-A-disaccharide synthase N-terminal domain-containing protein [Phycisphaerales bacterium]